MPDMEKVIKDAEEAIEILRNVDEPTPWCDFVRVSVERALELLKEPTVGGWVSVEDRMPETRHAVLAFSPRYNNIWALCLHEDRNWYYWMDGGRRYYDPDWMGPITQWMPLPPGPEVSE